MSVTINLFCLKFRSLIYDSKSILSSYPIKRLVLYYSVRDLIIWWSKHHHNFIQEPPGCRIPQNIRKPTQKCGDWTVWGKNSPMFNKRHINYNTSRAFMNLDADLTFLSCSQRQSDERDNSTKEQNYGSGAGLREIQASDY